MRRLLNTTCILLLSQKHIKNKGYLLDHPPPYNFYSRGCLSYTPRYRIFCYLTWLGPSWREYFHQKCCCTMLLWGILYVFCDKERKNLFIHLKTVSNVLSFALHVKVFLCSLLTVSRGVCHRQPRTQYLMRDIINWTKLFWIDVLLYKNKTSHKDP